MAPELEPVLRELRAAAVGEDASVLTGLQKRKPMAEVVLTRAWRSLREFGPQAIRPLRLHDFRHTWATLALQAGRAGTARGPLQEGTRQHPIRSSIQPWERNATELGRCPASVVTAQT